MGASITHADPVPEQSDWRRQNWQAVCLLVPGIALLLGGLGGVGLAATLAPTAYSLCRAITRGKGTNVPFF